jgi:Restriction endonuclease
MSWRPVSDPYHVLNALLDHPEQVEHAWSQDVMEIGRRLVGSVGPNSFEHLCVALLQLEHPEHVWMHVGGSGDGGIDGIGADANGAVVGLLQCKWAYQSEDVFVDPQAGRSGTRQILVALLHSECATPREGIEFWPRPYCIFSSEAR